MESHDIVSLKKAIASASSAGVSFKSIEAAQRMLDFERNKEIAQDVMKVRAAIDTLAKAVEKVEAQVKIVAGGNPVELTPSVEAWIATIVRQVEEQIWQSLEKRVEDKV